MPSFATFGNELYTGERSINFVGRQRIWYAISGVVIILSLIGLFGRHLNLGLEFKGGSQFQVAHAKTTDDVPGVQAVHSVAPNADAEVTKLGKDTIRVQTGKLTGDAQTVQVQGALAKAYGVTENDVSSTFIGPSWGKQVSQKALTGLIVFLILVSAVIAIYFRTWTMALAGIIALLHDLIITVGVYALVGFEVSPASVIGFLTILGYSLYDTVVVFDKVRENTQGLSGTAKSTYSEAANLAVNQTLVRSINTSVVALLPILSILVIGTILVGAGTLEDLSLALFVGIAAGTYSSIFIATPLLSDLQERRPEMKALRNRVLKRRVAQGKAPGAVSTAGPTAAAVAAEGGEAQPTRGGTTTVTVERPGTRTTGPRNQPKRTNKGKRSSGKRR